MGPFKKKKPEQAQAQSQPKQEDTMGQMDPSIRPGGVFLAQLLMKEKCGAPSVERMTEVLSRHIGRVEAAEPSGQMADTIDGVTDGWLDQALQWKCRFEDAMVQPKRLVLDVRMNEFAARNR